MHRVVLLVCVASVACSAASQTLDPDFQPKFVNPLPIPKVLDATRAGTYKVDITQGEQWLGVVDPNTGAHLNTKLWSYGNSYPGPTIVTQKGVPIRLQWNNKLVDVLGQPLRHLLPIDTTIHWANPLGGPAGAEYLGPAPLVTHLHGGMVDADSDGDPEAWYTPNALLRGSRYNQVYRYDNAQEAASLWYHDHALGITRLNVYTGLSGMYLIHDPNEALLQKRSELPSGPYDIPLILQDKSFNPDGSLAYSPGDPMGTPYPSIQPEFFGEFQVVNGMTWPYLEVEPRQYRFRILNGADSRFYSLYLNGGNLTQIATDDGLLPYAITQRFLLLAPGERGEIIMDFTGKEGQTITLRNSAATPFPEGEPTAPWMQQVIQFRVTKPLSSVPKTKYPKNLRPLAGPMQQFTPVARTRKLLIYETMDEFGRLKPMLGTIQDGIMMYGDPVTELIRTGDTEIWEIYNTSDDVHPIHLHAVSFQMLERQVFTAEQDPLSGALTDIQMVGPTIPPHPYQSGRKDTLATYGQEVTRIKVRFEHAGRYVWHCHILSHEDHAMMRPLLVGP